MATHSFKLPVVAGRVGTLAELYAYPNVGKGVVALYTTTTITLDAEQEGMLWAQFTPATVLPVAFYRIIVYSATGRPIASGIAKSTGITGEHVEAFEAPVLASGDFATGTAQTAAAANLTTLLARLTANAGTVLDSLWNMVTHAGATSAFKALALQLGPNGASSVWTTEDIVIVKAKLDLLTMSQSVIVVPIGSYMCGRGDIEHIFGKVNVAKWADIDNTGVSGDITDQITYAISISDSDFRSKLLASRWNMPQSGDICPAILVHNVAALAGVYLYENKGVQDYDAQGEAEHQLSMHRKRVDQFVNGVINGTINLSPLTYAVTTAAPTFEVDVA